MYDLALASKDLMFVGKDFLSVEKDFLALEKDLLSIYQAYSENHYALNHVFRTPKNM
jgi:hypothetical protein